MELCLVNTADGLKDLEHFDSVLPSVAQFVLGQEYSSFILLLKVSCVAEVIIELQRIGVIGNKGNRVHLLSEFCNLRFVVEERLILVESSSDCHSVSLLNQKGLISPQLPKAFGNMELLIINDIFIRLRFQCCEVVMDIINSANLSANVVTLKFVVLVSVIQE